MFFPHRGRPALGLVALSFTAIATARAPACPSKPLPIVLTSTPGAPSAIVMPMAGEKMQATLKRAVVIENKALTPAQATARLAALSKQSGAVVKKFQRSLD